MSNQQHAVGWVESSETHQANAGIDEFRSSTHPTWLGEVPAHWETKKLKYIGKAIIGLTYDPKEISDDGIVVLRATNIQNGFLSLDDVVRVKKQIPTELITKSGDIFICSRNGSRHLIGKNVLIDRSAEGYSFGAFTTVFRSPMNDFVYYVFNSDLFSYQSGLFMTSTVNQLTTSMLNIIWKYRFPQLVSKRK